ncbi:hypothetical protein UlMin_002051 [Ulmus minor]
MAEETQSWPLAPARVYNRSDEENPTFKAIRRERNNKCFVYVFLVIVILSIILLVFSLVVLRPKSPDVKLRSVMVRNLRYTTSKKPSLNATLVAQVMIKNPNFGYFVLENRNVASFFYRGTKFGEKRIQKGSVDVRETKKSSVVVDLRSSKLPENQNLGNDLNSGFLKLSFRSKIVGEVHLMKIFKNKRTSYLNCNMTLNLKRRRVKDLLCN